MLMIIFNAIVSLVCGYYAVQHFKNEENWWGWFSLIVSALNAALVLKYIV